MKAPTLIWTRSPYAEFDARSLDGLVEAVETLRRGTLVTEVGDVRDLVLDRHGRLRDGSQYTQAGLRQVAQWAAPGTYQLVRDLALGRMGKDAVRADPLAAIDVFNRVVRFRIERFVGRAQLMRNVMGKTVDGVLGPGYVLYENGDFLERAGQALPDHVLRRATFAGRLLSLRYAARRPLIQRGERRVFAGAQLINSEVGGEASVRVAVCLVFEPQGFVFLGPPLGGRVLHAGRTFRDRLAKAFGLLERFEFDARDVNRRLDGLARSDLITSSDEHKVAARGAHVAAVLTQRGVPKLAADRASRAALLGDTSRPGSSPARRSVWDLASALARQALAVPTRGEPLERAAYDLLFGKFHP